ncbi:MAG: glycine oxidase ThiO [Planctomycetaceae bacterium]|nr:glycine oxidase ThiO [Planctomycetaceae bacterium]
MPDCLIIGGGIIGLSAAYELARQGASVRVINCQRSQRSASWAAAGILPPPISRAKHDAMEQLRHLSHQLYPAWCDLLHRESGVDVEFHRCGGVYVARRPGERAALRAALDQWRQDGVQLEQVDHNWLNDHEPALAGVRSAYWLPDEAIVHPPRLLDALTICLQREGVTVDHQVQFKKWISDDARITGVDTTDGIISADQICVATGPWSQEIAADLGLDLPVEPRRGQMLLWQLDKPIIRGVVNEGPRYLLARKDGCLLAGSTVEEVGFDDRNTPAGVADLTEFAVGLLPALRNDSPTQTWAGLRPFSRDGFPYLGRLPQWNNVTIATGHFRSGIHLAPATARIVASLMTSQSIDVNLAPFSPTRT